LIILFFLTIIFIMVILWVVISLIGITTSL
jgi:hypothetical protein